MSIIESIILGIVEGLTEFLPVSSTGHLIITQYLLDMPDSNAMKAFEVCIQLGAILAVLGIYFSRIREMASGGIELICRSSRIAMRLMTGKKGKKPLPPPSAGLRMLLNVVIGFIPAAILGILFDDMIKNCLFNATTVTVTWALGGLAILLYVWHRKRSGRGSEGKSLEELSWKGAFCIGALQCIAMCPGTSRSLMTMLGGLFVGLSVAATVEFSFLLGLVTLSAATVWDMMKHGAAMVEQIGWVPMAVGTITAGICAFAAVQWMVGYLNRHSLAIFGWYRLAAAAFMAILIYNGLSIN